MNNQEKKRYQRQLLLPGFGEEAQEKLKKASVFVVGAGGLGSPASIYLAAAGVGKIIICDKDSVELSNLNRQILHGTKDIGIPKIKSAEHSLTDLNPNCIIETHHIDVDEKVMFSLASDSSIILDCLDNIETRMALNSYCIKSGTPMIHAGIDSWSGQLTLIKPPETACVNCLFETYQELSHPKPVLGAVAGIIGTTQALAALKYLVGMDTGLKNHLLHFDGRTMDWMKLEAQKNTDCIICSGL